MSDSDLTALLREHRMIRNQVEDDPDDAQGFFCSRHDWSTEARTALHAHDEFVVHIASVLSGVYAITPLPDVKRAVQLYREVTPNDATSDWATHHGSYDTVYSSIGGRTWTRAECDHDTDAELIAAAVNLVASIARAQETSQ